jgi:hypothetical protein
MVPPPIVQGEFRWERQLSRSFRRHNLATHCKRGYSIRASLAESTCSEGRADLVCAIRSNCKTPRWLRERAELLVQPMCSRILAVLKPLAPRTEQYLLCKTGVTAKTLRAALRTLTKEDLIRQTPTGGYVLHPKFELPAIEIHAFEFKLHNWRRALYQATRYKSFSHRVYVVLPPAAGQRAIANKRLFTGLNIGLVVHDPNGESDYVLQPRRRTPPARYRYIMAIGMIIKNL